MSKMERCEIGINYKKTGINLRGKDRIFLNIYETNYKIQSF